MMSRIGHQFRAGTGDTHAQDQHDPSRLAQCCSEQYSYTPYGVDSLEAVMSERVNKAEAPKSSQRVPPVH